MPAFILVPSQRGENDIPKLTLAGALVATFYLFTGAYLTPASWSFLVYAHAIADGTRVPATAGFASRDLGFPLLALLSGYTITESIIPLTVIQAIFAILIPVFVYKSVSQFSRITAFYAGYITIISLTPYLFMKMIHHDETYMFFMMLMITLLLRYFQTSRLPYLYAFTAAALAASLTRPAGNLLLPVFLTLGYFYERKRLPHYAVSALILVTCSIYYKWQHDQFFPLQPGETLPSYTGQQVFYDPYINSTEYGIALSPDTNLSMAEISRAVLHYTDPDPSKVPLLHNNPNFPTDSPFVKKRIDDLSPRELSRQVFSIPCFQYFVLMGQAEPDDKVFMSAALDIITSHPIYTLRYTLRNFLLFLFRPGYAHPVNSPDGSCGPLTRIGTVFYPDYARIFGNPLEVAIRPVMAREVSFIPSLRPRLVGFIYSLITRAWLTYYDRLLEFASILTVSSWLIIVAALDV